MLLLLLRFAWNRVSTPGIHSCYRADVNVISRQHFSRSVRNQRGNNYAELIASVRPEKNARNRSEIWNSCAVDPIGKENHSLIKVEWVGHLAHSSPGKRGRLSQRREESGVPSNRNCITERDRCTCRTSEPAQRIPSPGPPTRLITDPEPRSANMSQAKPSSMQSRVTKSCYRKQVWRKCVNYLGWLGDDNETTAND